MGTSPFAPQDIDLGTVTPGQNVTWHLQSDFFSSDANVTATISNDTSGGAFTVQSLTSYKRVMLPPDSEPTDELLGGHRPLRPPPPPYEDQPQLQTDGKTPLAVINGQLAGIVIQFIGPSISSDNPFTATLQIKGDVFDATLVPLKALVRGFSIDIPPIIAVGMGDTTIPFSVKLVAGPPTNVTLTQTSGQPGTFISAFPPSFAVSVGTLGVGTLHITPGSETPGGNLCGLAVDAFDTRLMFVPITVQTLNEISVTLLNPTPITLHQGGTATLYIQVSAGMDPADPRWTNINWIGINLVPFGLPNGVMISSLSSALSSANVDASGSRIVAVTLTVDPFAPIVQRLPLTLNWSASLDEYGRTSPLAIGSITPVITIIPAQITLQADIVTGGLSGLGGTVALVLGADGSYTFRLHMWNTSKVTGYDYHVNVMFRSPGGVMFAAQHNGHVSTEDLLGAAETDDYGEQGIHSAVQHNWTDIVNGSIAVSHEYSPSSGPLGVLESLAQDALVIFTSGLAAGAIGAGFGTVYALGKESRAAFGDLGAAFAVLAGMVVFGVELAVGASTETALIYATIAGVAAGAVEKEQIKDTVITAEEYNFANSGGQGGSNYQVDPDNASVFMGILPPMEKIHLTNLCNPDRGRAFTVRLGDTYYVNLGAAYGQPLNPDGNPPAYPTKGQLLIHELTHAVQIEYRNSFAVICSGISNGLKYIFGDDVYKFGPAGPDWHSDYFNLESQAHVVDAWFAGVDSNGRSTGLGSMSTQSPYFRYITQLRNGDI